MSAPPDKLTLALTKVSKRTGMVTPAEVYEIVGLRRSAIAQRVARGDFPAPVYLAANHKLWRAADVADWLDQA